MGAAQRGAGCHCLVDAAAPTLTIHDTCQQAQLASCQQRPEAALRGLDGQPQLTGVL